MSIRDPQSETENGPQGGLIATLETLHDTAPDEGLTLGEIADGLGERAFGVLLFALAIPVCMPFLYGVPQIVALPMMAIALQMAAGRDSPWMPRKFAERRIDKPGLARMAHGARKGFGWVESRARPRLAWLSGPTAERAVGAIFVLFCASILVPLPATNTTPGIGIALASIGLITRDGVFVMIGLALGTLWIAILIIGFAFFGTAFLDLVKEFVMSFFSSSQGV